MGELFEGVLGIIIMVIAISRLNKNSKKVKQNRPGQSSGIPQNPAPAQPQQAEPVQRSFWEQMVMELEKAAGDEDAPEMKAPVPARPKAEPLKPVKTAAKTQKHDGHAAVGSLAEGTSRECDYGSIGGSMAYTHTDGEAEGRRTIAVQNTQSEPQTAYCPAMTAEEMRQAIVMAEILKTPQERMAEQARRWNRQ